MGIEIGRKCSAHNCQELAETKGLCGKHYKRQQRHGNSEYDSRPKVIGYDRNKDHPLYNIWRTITRMDRGLAVSSEWKSFIRFVGDVGDRPSDRHQLRRKLTKGFWELSNVYWAAPRENYEEHKEYLKLRQRRARQADPDYSKTRSLRKNYNLTLEQYNQMLEDQEHVCKICGQPETKKKHGLSVDHDHITGRIRGLLCGNCNSICGHANDSVGLLKKVIEYLEK